MILVQDADFTLYVGDVLESLRELPDESVHCVVTSPPYWGLRDYGTGSWDGGNPDCDHKRPNREQRYFNGRGEDHGRGGAASAERSAEPFTDVCGKCGATRVDQQLGLEATPDLFVASMVAVFREVRRVLRRDGTCWVNLGDSYAGGKTDRDDHDRNRRNPNGPEQTRQLRKLTEEPQGRQRPVPSGLKPKDLCMIPAKVAIALQEDGWYLRADIIWSKPNPMPESVTDRPTKAHEYVFLLTRSPRYFFDADAVRETSITNDPRRPYTSNGAKQMDGRETWHSGERRNGDDFTGRNVRSVWEIATQPYPEAHFATFPEELPRRCILAGTSERGCCPECGAPWERETTARGQGDAFNGEARNTGRPDGAERRNPRGGQKEWDSYTPPVTTGWRPTCGCGGEGGTVVGLRLGGCASDRSPVPCTVLDPFMGSGTTALVARRHGRRSIGIELNPEYANLCARRLQQLSLFAGAS